MSLKNGKRRMRRMPLSVAITGLMSMWAMCTTAVAGDVLVQAAVESQCDSDSELCQQAKRFAGRSIGLNGDGMSILAGSFGSGSGISIGTAAYIANATLIGDIALGGASVATGSGVNYSIAVGDYTLVSAGNVGFGQRAVANTAGITNSVALGAQSVVDRSNAVSVGTSGQTRRIQNVSAGIANNDVINVDQLSSVVETLGGTINAASGAVTMPVFSVGGVNQPTLVAALTTLDNSMSATQTLVTNLVNDVNNGAIGLVKQDAITGNILFGAGANGAAVDFTGAVDTTLATRQLKGLSLGDVGAASTDAINGLQLYATNQQVGQNSGDITEAFNRISSISDGAAGLVMQHADTQAISVGSSGGGSVVDVTGSAGVRTLTGIAEGNASSINSSALITGGQLYVTNQQITSIDTRVTQVMGDITDIQKSLGDLAPSLVDVITYDDITKSGVTLAGAEGTLLTGVAPALIAAGSTQMVNGGQLFDFNAFFEGQIGDLGDRAIDLEGQYADVEKQIEDGTLQPGAFNGDVSGERITNVAAGIADTDAANVGQMTDMLADAVTQAQNYTQQQAAAFDSSLQSFKGEVDQRFKRQDERLDRIGAMNAASTHMAINAAGAKSSRGRAAVGVGTQNGKGAVALGYARPIGERTHLSIGGSFSGPEQSAGIGLSVSL